MIRAYREDDAELLCSYLEEIRVDVNYPPTKLSGEELIEWFNPGDLDFRLVYVDQSDKPLGHVSGRSRFPESGNTAKFLAECPSETGLPWMELSKLFVAPEESGAGIGAKLLEAAVGQIRSLGFSPCLIVNSDSDAIPFYEKRGWTELGIFPAAADDRQLLAMTKLL